MNIFLEAQLLKIRYVTPSLTHDVTFSFFEHIFRIDLDVRYGYATNNLMRKLFLMVAGVKMLGIGGGYFNFELYLEI